MSEIKIKGDTMIMKVGETEVNSQLDRIEKKLDRILELLEGKDLSVSYDSIEIGNLCDIPDDVLKRNNLGKYAK
ncbi:hypothetical protein B4065_3362 [Caldibacillus thermoamylovorans]|uniref:hypothetical protein n=1 Tax=Caldibacillus thermoamylovorans TaxID=35841 RepID=UPI0005A42F61|nr:hypothetical protein [Caldibacillus thermoamylovorans]KIO62142.1 hypothetical protein B4065_3362 [Caldibacillus thermoamylovorans]